MIAVQQAPGANLAPGRTPLPTSQPETGPAQDAIQDPFGLDKLKKQFLDYQTLKDEEIAEQRQARRYYHGAQWTAAEIRELRRRGQPPSTKNVIAKTINKMVGVVERARQDPKAYPRHPKNDEGASVASATLNYVLDEASWEQISTESTRNAGIDGIAGIELTLIPGDKGDPEIGINIVDGDTFFYDPRSVRNDFSDAGFMGVAKWVDIDTAQAMFPEFEDQLESMMTSMPEITTLSDREFKWANSTSRTLVLVYHCYRSKGDWYWCFYVADVKLLGAKSWLIDEKGKTKPNLIMWSSEVDHEGDRYGPIRNLRSLQDEINQRTSKMLFMSNSRRIISDKGAVDDVERSRVEFARADGWIEKNPGKELKRDDQSFDFGGHAKLLEEAKAEVASYLPDAATLSQGGGKSGRSIALLQQQALASLGYFIISRRNWRLRVYRATWNLIQRYWTADRWIRVTDDNAVAQFVQLNGLTLDQFGRPALVNHLGSLDVDIKLDEGPDMVTVYADAYEALKGVPGVPPDIIIELIPGLQTDVRQRILQRLRNPNPLKQQAEQMELAKGKADIGAVKAKSLKTVADSLVSLTKAGKTMADLAQPETLPPILNPGADAPQGPPPLPGHGGPAGLPNPQMAAILANLGKAPIPPGSGPRPIPPRPFSIRPANVPLPNAGLPPG